MAPMDVSVQLRLLDQMSAPARRAAEALRNIERRARALRPAARGIDQMARAYDRLAASAARAQARVNALRGKAFGVALGAFGLSLPLKVGSDYEKALVRFGQVSGWSPEEMLQRTQGLSEELTQLSRATRQSTDDLLQGLTTIVNLGVPAEEARRAMEGIGRSATATGAVVDDLARTWHAAFEHLGLTADQSERMFNILHQAGKEGGFELPDMAKFFPSFLANIGALYAGYIARMTAGMSPEEARRWRNEFALRKLTEIATWAQIVRLGAADSQTAGTNLQNMLQKNLIDETAKNFKDALGIDFRQALWQHVEQGGDPILFIADQVAKYVEQKGGNALYLGELFADKQAMEGYLPVIRKVLQERGKLAEFMKGIYNARDRGIISKDFASTVNTVSFAFSYFTAALNEVYKKIVLFGVRSQLIWFFELLGNVLYETAQWMDRNKELAGWLIRIGSGVMSAMGALILLRFVMSALQLAFARAGMGAITLARVIPGAAAALGLLSTVVGRLVRFGVIGGVLGGLGFLAWEHWDQLKPYIQSVGNWFLDFLGRLSTLFPETFSWFTDTALPAITAWLERNFSRLTSLFSTLIDAGRQLWETLKWLFTGEGEATVFDDFKSSLSELGGIIGNLLPGFESIREFFSKLWEDLGSDSFFTRIWAWMKLAGVGFLGATGGLILARGPAGLLMSLMALRTIMFMAGIMLGLFSMLASIVATFLTPFIESFFDSDLWKHRLAGPVAGLFGSIFMVIAALIIFREHWEAVKAAFSGFVEGVQSILGPAFDALKSAWNELMRTLFGEGEVSYTEKDLQDILSFWRTIGRLVGAVPAYAFRGLAWAIRELTDALRDFRDLIGQERFDAFVTWGARIAGFAFALFALRGAITAVWQALRWFLTRMNPFSPLGRAMGFGFGLISGTAIGKGIEALRSGQIGKWGGRLLRLGGGPLGWFLILLTVLGAIIDNIETIKKELNDLANWGQDTWIGKLLGTGEATGGWLKDTWYGQLLDYLQGKMMEPFSSEGVTPQIGPEIQDAGKQAAADIEGAGNETANALRRVAAALQSIASSIASSVQIPGGSLANRAEGQMADAPYSSYP